MTYLFPNYNGATVEDWEWLSHLILLYWACDYLPMLWLKSIHVNKRDRRQYHHDCWRCPSVKPSHVINIHVVTDGSYC